MIRRIPTLIAMSDGDVQDVRDMVKNQNRENQDEQSLPVMPKENDAFQQFEKAKRLGLQPEQPRI